MKTFASTEELVNAITEDIEVGIIDETDKVRIFVGDNGEIRYTTSEAIAHHSEHAVYTDAELPTAAQFLDPSAAEFLASDIAYI